MMETAIIDNLVLTDKDFQKIGDLVYKHCGINLHMGKKELVRARLAKRLRLGNFRTYSEYMKHVLADKSGKQFSILIDTLSTNLTSFFREGQHFEFLQNNFLPALLDRKERDRNFKIRAWSAGCSSGEEPYSIAITLLEAAQEQSRWNVKVLATDISTTMLQTAKAGIYSKERVKPVPTLQKNKYLNLNCVRGEKTFEAKKNLKNIVIFKYASSKKFVGSSRLR